MSTHDDPTDEETAPTANDGLSLWDEVRQITDELEVKIHLAGMDLRDRWHALEPRIAALQKDLASSGARTGHALKQELSTVWTSLRKLRTDLLGDGAHS